MQTESNPSNRKKVMERLIILPSAPNVLGGTLISLSLLIEGFEHQGAKDSLRVLVMAGSLMEEYLNSQGYSHYLKVIEATEETFFERSLQWVKQQPKEYTLLLDNCVQRRLLVPLILAAPSLRLSQRSVYLFFHDLAISYNPIGSLLRKIGFTLLDAKVVCNSKFTASYIRRYSHKIKGILYQPVDTKRFYKSTKKKPVPEDLKPILETGLPIMLTPSRINKPGIINNKNLKILPQILASLKEKGVDYYGVIVGQDRSPDKVYSQTLLAQAETLGVADRFAILPPTFVIENYYQHAAVVVTLAPREPFGRTVVEAIACGVPVVGSNTGGIGEILSNFAPQWTVDPDDADAAAEAIIRIVKDPQTSSPIEEAQHWVESECSVTGYAKKMMQATEVC